MAQMAALYATKGFGSADAFTTAAKNVTLVSALDPQAENLEGYLFPDTYTLTRTTTTDQLIARMVERFDKALTEATREQAAARGLNVRQLVTLASIVEKETGNAVGAAARRGGLQQPAAARHAAPVRSDRHLRAGARRHLQRQSHARQTCSSTPRTTRIATRDCRQARLRTLDARRSRPPRIRRTCRICTSSAQRRDARVRLHDRGAQSERRAVSAEVLPGPETRRRASALRLIPSCDSHCHAARADGSRTRATRRRRATRH